MLLCLEHIGKLTTKCGLTRTLQTAHQYYRRLASKLDIYSLATHQGCQLVVNNLHHQLAWLYRC